MRRVISLLLVAAASGLASAGASATAAAAAAPAQSPPGASQAGRGLNFAGLTATNDSTKTCRSKFALVGASSGATPRCTHGPDPAPPGIDVRTRQPTLVGDTATPTSSPSYAAGSTVPCYGDGVTGNRVQAIYAHAADVGDRYGQVL